MPRRLLLTFLSAAAAFLLPWTGYLAVTLPESFDTGAWRPAWVGFDIALAVCFGLAAWLTARRRRGAAALLAATATLLCCDAWFDVLLDWSGPDRWTSLAMAVLVELPIAAGLAWLANRMPNGAPARRTLTRADVDLMADAETRRVVRIVREGAEPSPADEPALARLAAAGYVRRDADGRWRPARQNLHMPGVAEVPEPDRAAVAGFLAEKYAHELRVLAWAGEHRDEFGPWANRTRVTTHLTADELARFGAEYEDLVQRYYLRRSGPAGGTREVLLSHYAFPVPEDSELAVQQPGPGPRL